MVRRARSAPALADRSAGSVYDLSKFVDMHPGGAYVIQDSKVAGKDATEAFFQVRHDS